MGTDTNEAAPSKPSKTQPDLESQSKGASGKESRGAASQRAGRDAGKGQRPAGRTGRPSSAPRRLYMPSSDEEEKADPDSPEAPPPPARAGPSRSEDDDDQFDSARSAGTRSTETRESPAPKPKSKSSKQSKAGKDRSPRDEPKTGAQGSAVKRDQPKAGPPSSKDQKPAQSQNRAAGKSKPTKTSSPRPSLAEVSSDKSSTDDQPRSPTLTEQVEEARRASGQSFSLGPGKNGLGGARIRTAQLVRDALSTWVNTPAARVFPRATGSPRRAPQIVTGRSFTVLDRCAQTTWMHFFELIKQTNPSEPRLELFAIQVDQISALEMVAVLQSALFQTGYSFVNLIPVICSGDPKLAHVQSGELLNDVQETIGYLRVEVEEWMHYKHYQSQMKPVNTAAFDLSAMRQQVSELSSESPATSADMSSGWYMASSPSERSSLSSESVAPPPRPVRFEPPASAQPVAAPPPAPEGTPATTHQGPRVGYPAQVFTSPSQYQFRQPAVAPVVPPPATPAPTPVHTPYHQPRPSAFDEPMRPPSPIATLHPPVTTGLAQHAQAPTSAQQPAVAAQSRPTPIRMDTRAAPDAAGTGAMPVVYGQSASGAPVAAPAAISAPPAQLAGVMMNVASQPQTSQVGQASQGTVPDPYLAFRPFIPSRLLDWFFGTEKFADRKAWLKEYKYIAQYWTDQEKCKNMKLYLRGAALAWYKQLGAARHHWPSLCAAFDAAFCTAPGSALDQYYEMTQRKDETPLQHLWRLNAAAKEARVPVTAPKDVEEHINRFLRTLVSEDLRSSLATHPFTSVNELQKVLEKLENLQNRRESSRSSSRDRERERERARERERSCERESRDRSTPRSAAVYYTYDSDRGFEPVDSSIRGVHFEDDEEPDSEASDGELVYQALGQSAPKASAGWRPSNQYPQKSLHPRSALGAGQQVGGVCYKCGQPGHFARECPNVEPPTSAPKEAAKKPCLLCELVHGPGECEVKNTLAEIKSWMKANAPAAGASPAPAGPQQPLN